MSPEIVTQERLKTFLNYDPETGLFTWLVPVGQAKRNKTAGRMNHNGYCQIGLFGARFSAHRLAWLYVFGEWPSNSVDHINGDRSDNRIANLRLANRSQNGANSRAPSKSKYGKGVRLRSRGKFQAYVTSMGHQHHLGLFDTPQEAAAAYLRKATELFGEFARQA